MCKGEKLSNSNQKMSKGRFHVLEQTIKPCHVSNGFKWKVGWLAIILIFFFTLSAEADIVSGRVYDSTRTFRPGDEITITGKDPNGNRISVKAPTDKKDGSYRVSLPPGIYEVEFKKDNKTLRGKIQSFPRPIQQDIYLIE
jgi:hypothetical protein